MAGESAGIVGDVKGLAATGLRAVRTRLELLAIEISEEKAWMVRLLAVAVTGLYLVSFGLLLAVFALVLWAPEENRPTILACCAVVFLLLGGAGIAYVASASRGRNSLFHDTVAVLKGDERALSQGLKGTGD